MKRFLTCLLCVFAAVAAEAATLPSGYQAVEYIESTKGGQQYIDTGIAARKSLRATMDYVAFEHAGAISLGTANNDDADWRYFDHSEGPLFDCGKTRVGECLSGNALALNVRYFVNVGTVGETAYLVVTNVNTKAEVKSFTAACDGDPRGDNITVLGGSVDDESQYTHMRLYSLAIYEGEKLERDFVPCVELATGRAGLYDTVYGKFYGNAGTGADFKTDLVRVPYWDPETKSERIAWCEEVTKGTVTLEDGKWYAVTGTVSRAKITVNGSAHLILCDGAKLSVEKPAERCAGVCVQGDASLAIYGQTAGTGALVATGDNYAAGIGGGIGGSGGEVTINGGTVTATGGAGGAGIGGGFKGNGGPVTINGGTVTARAGAGAMDIGKGSVGTEFRTLIINGGSVKANIADSATANRKGEQLQCVTVPMSGLRDSVDGLRIECLPDHALPAYYNTAGIHPVENAIYIRLPPLPKGYMFSVSDGLVSRCYFAVVTDRNVTVEPLTAGFLVNGQDVGNASGDGWTYVAESGQLTLNSPMNYVIEGYASNDLAKIVVAANATVVLSNAVIETTSTPAITVNDDVTLTLSAVGDSASYLLTGNQPAIQGGKTIVEGGSLCLWSESAIPVAGAFSVALGEFMRAGESAAQSRCVDSYVKDDSYRILLVGPRCQLGVPYIPNATIEVWCQDERLEEGSAKEGVRFYDLMQGDTAIVRVVPDAGYVLRGPPAERYFEIDGNRTLASTELPDALMGLHAHYRAARVDATTATEGNLTVKVSNWTATVDAVLFDEVTNRLETIGKGAYGEEWYVVTGELECASICVTEGAVNLILYPGASLTLEGEDGEPGLGVMSNACLNIYGCEDGVGSLISSGGLYAAGIGGGGAVSIDGAPDADAGWITVNGGQVIAYGGDFGAGIGGGAFGAGAYLEVNGGSVIAYRGYDAEDIGGGVYGEDGVTVVNGGSLMANSVEAKPVNAAGVPVYRAYAVSGKFIPANDMPLTVKGLIGYGTADIFANEDGEVCLYLPNGHYEFSIDGWECVADVQDGTASAVVTEERVQEGESREQGGEGEGEEVPYAKVLGIEVGETVKVTVRAKKDFAYYLVRVTFEGGKLVEDSTAGYGYAEDDTLTLEDENPPAGSGFYVVEEFEL